MYCTSFKTRLPTLVAIYSRAEAFDAASDDAITAHIARHLVSTDKFDRCIRFVREDLRRTGKEGAIAPERLVLNMVRTLRATTSTRRRGDASTKLVAVHLEAPISDEDEKAWFAFRDLFRTFRFGTGLSGFPVIYEEPLRCGICHGAEHDTGMCALPDMSEWHGPGKETSNTNTRVPGPPAKKGKFGGGGGKPGPASTRGWKGGR